MEIKRYGAKEFLAAGKLCIRENEIDVYKRQLSVKHESVAKVRLGADALGNITRINNLLESYPEKLAEAEQRLETVQELSLIHI